MIQQVNAALLELQGAFLARSLYPKEHPRIRTCEDRAVELLGEVLVARDQITVFAVDQRVIFDNQILPASVNLARTLFRGLHGQGIDRVTLHRGLTVSEVQRLLDALVGPSEGPTQPPRSSEHIVFSSLQDLDSGAYGTWEVADGGDLVTASEAAEALADMWQEIDADTPRTPSVLGDIVSSLSRVVQDSSGAVLPLARLKRHDEYTFVHTVNVAMLSSALGEALGFRNRDAHELTIAALLHDIGKRAIPTELLNKAGRFTKEEFHVMQGHPVAGARMLLSMPHVPEVAPIVAFEHHIRADGSGYPRVPTGWRLSLASRIVQIADVFDALRTDRPYRRGEPVARIVEIMRQDVGPFFDADLLLIFFQEVVSRGIPAAARAGEELPRIDAPAAADPGVATSQR